MVDKIALKPYLEKISEMCDGLTKAEMTAAVLDLAKEVSASDRKMILRGIEAVLPGRQGPATASVCPPLQLKIDFAKSMRSIVSDLMELAYARQREMPGTMVAGAVMEHLVGAKLEISMPNAEISHKGFSVADSSGDRGGDFQIEDTIIHVTTAPSEALIRKCADNLSANFRPVVITTQSAAGGAAAHARNAGIEDRFDILEVDQFIATNIYEWSGFRQTNRKLNFKELVDVYNRIVKETETDPSLLIAIG
jgi:hypothetical protein